MILHAELQKLEMEPISSPGSARVCKPLTREKPVRIVLKIIQKAGCSPGQKEAQSAVQPSQSCPNKLTSAKGPASSVQEAEPSNALDVEKAEKQGKTQQLDKQIIGQADGITHLEGGEKMPAVSGSQVYHSATAGTVIEPSATICDRLVRQNCNSEELQQIHQSPTCAHSPQLAYAPAVATAVHNGLKAKSAAPFSSVPAAAKTLQKKPVRKNSGQQKPGKKKSALKSISSSKKGQASKKGRLAKLRQIVSTSAKLSSASHFAGSSSARPVSKVLPNTRKPATEQSVQAEVALQRNLQSMIGLPAKPESYVEQDRPLYSERQAVQEDGDTGANRHLVSLPPSFEVAARKSHQAAQEETNELLDSSGPVQHSVPGYRRAMQSGCGLKPRQEGESALSQREQDREGLVTFVDLIPTPSHAPPKLLQTHPMKPAKLSLKTVQSLEASQTSKLVSKGRGLSMLHAARLRSTQKQKQPNLLAHGVFFELTPRLSSTQPDSTSATPADKQQITEKKARSLNFTT